MNSKNKTIAFATAGLFVLVGLYNAVVINSESAITDVSIVKRLDEMYGVTVPGRQIAGAKLWKKLEPSKVVAQKTLPEIEVSKTETTPAFVQENTVSDQLNLTLVEVINQKKFQNGLPNSQFNGSLSTNQGVIESLSVSLPNGEGVSVSFAEMTGNVFEYDLNGNIYSGLMFQVDQNSYVVTLTNGPLEGTRLRFTSQPQASQQEVLAESNVETGSFGSEPQNTDPLIQNDQELQEEAVQAQGFNLGNSQTL